MEKLSQARLLVLGFPRARQGSRADAPSSAPPLAERTNGWHWLVAVLFVLLLCVNGWGCSAPAGEQIILTPDAEASVDVKAAAALWGKETGLDIEVGLGGVPVAIVDQVYVLDGIARCGVSIFYRSGRVEIQIVRSMPGCAERRLLVLHEIGHVICDRTDCHLDAGVSGLMGKSCKASGPTDDIDAASVDVVLHI